MPTGKPIVIMGAGPAGLTAAFELVRAGREVVVWEVDPSYVGGVARTVQADGHRFDVGGHRFVTVVPEVQEFWRTVLPTDMVEFTPSASILFRGKSYKFPLESTSAAFNLGVVESARIYSSYFTAKARPVKDETTFTQWTTKRYGDRLAESFFKPFVEKMWGISGDQLSAEWAAQNLRYSLGDLLTESEPRTAAYPRLGSGQMWEAAANRVLELGNVVQLDRKVKTIHWNETGVTHVTGTAGAGGFFQQEGSHFISSMPLPDLMLSLDPPPPKEVVAAAKALRHRNVITVCLIVGREKLMPESWIFVNEPGLKVARLLNYKNWSPAMSGNPALSPLGMDYFCFEGDNLWNSTDHDLAQLAVREAVLTGVARESEIKDAYVHRMAKAFPLYDQEYAFNLNVIRQWVSLFANLQPVGRSGMHRYLHQDASMLTALVAVRNIQGGSYDCWKVNHNAEYREKE